MTGLEIYWLTFVLEYMPFLKCIIEDVYIFLLWPVLWHFIVGTVDTSLQYPDPDTHKANSFAVWYAYVDKWTGKKKSPIFDFKSRFGFEV